MTADPVGTWRCLAPAKVNLGLFVGPVGEDGRHELATVMQSISLADEVQLGPAPEGAVADEVHCPGVEGPNLAGEALAGFRKQFEWDAPPLALHVEKRIPVAAGLAGGSADAAATLRLAAAVSGRGDERQLLELAAQLGADVPAQVRPGRWLARGAGERLAPLRPPQEPLAVLLLPVEAELSTAAVYAEADRLGLTRDAVAVAASAQALQEALASGAALPPVKLLPNDLQDAARSLCPLIDVALGQAWDAGADHALVSGSGPTVLALFGGEHAGNRAAHAREKLAPRAPMPILAVPVDAEFARPVDARLRHNEPLR